MSAALRRPRIISSHQRIDFREAMRNRFSVAVIVLNCVLLSCAVISCSSQERLVGIWRNEQRTLTFSEDSGFLIHFTSSKTIRAFSGKYSVRGSVVYLAFEKYLDGNDVWTSVAGTDLEEYIESMRFSVFADKLVTEIIASEAVYEYSRVKE